MTDFLDHYCERTIIDIWSEPYNIISNIGFLAVSIVVMHKIHSTGPYTLKSSWDIWLLSVMVFVVGIGSALWHIFAQNWALLTDQIPILLFINIYLLSCLIRIVGLSIKITLLIFVAYHVLNFAMQLSLPAGFLNGSIFYLPTLLFLGLVTLYMYHLKLNNSTRFIFAFLIFSIALVFRTLDLETCNLISVGTHFIWHLLIAITMYLLMVSLIYGLSVQQIKPANEE